MKRSFVIALHIGYWILYLLLLCMFILFMKAGSSKSIVKSEYIAGFLQLMSSFTLIPALLSFYIFYSFLFTRYLSSKKIAALCVGGLVTIFISGIAGASALKFANNGLIFKYNDWSQISIMVLFMSILALVHGIIALVIRGFIKWYADIKIKEELQLRNFETELALVKSQLNPHFLFNTINNIDVLIEKDAGKASLYLNKLSDIMRFMLYETKTDTIPLQKELTYINKYIDLQKIRTFNANFVKSEILVNADSWMIAPMLFIPFIENAFKHTGNKKNDHAIFIKITATEDVLSFYCENHFSENHLTTQEAGGLGNDLIKKRLNLLYPGKHTLTIEKQQPVYKVRLVIYSKKTNTL